MQPLFSQNRGFFDDQIDPQVLLTINDLGNPEFSIARLPFNWSLLTVNC